jgi:hypothetical protein
MEQRIKEIVSRFSKLRVDAFSMNQHPLNTNVISKNALKEKTEEITKNELTPKEIVKKPAKDQTPMMMKKINRHYQELSKNNLKKQKQAFVFHGLIDDYQKELEKKL